ncbi:MAG TPA: hypothetical protein VGI80_00240, partial [Pyrinomonadaceae bacterium]
AVIADGWETTARGHLAETPVKIDSTGTNDNARMTPGFEDLFDRGGLAKSDWRIITGTICDERDKQLFLTAGETPGGIGREQLFEDVEVVVNARCETLREDSAFGIGLYYKDGEPTLSMFVFPAGVDLIGSGKARFDLPAMWEMSDYHAYRLVARDGKAQIWLEQFLLGEIPIDNGPYCAAVLAQNVTVTLDMVRVTGI